MKTIYQQCKNQLANDAKYIRKAKPNDKPMIRQYINDTVDYLSKENQLSEYHRNLLSNYACKLHPK